MELVQMPYLRTAINQYTVKDRQTGVGLIEVLIAILVLSIGLLGMAALQAKALSTNNSAMARSMVVLASYSILEAMRADRSNALAGNYNTTVYGNNCPTTQNTLAETQTGVWCALLQNKLGALKSTQGTVSCQSTGACQITIQFDDSHAGTEGSVGSTTQTVITNAML